MAIGVVSGPIAVDAAGLVYVSVGQRNHLFVVDPKANKLVGTVPVQSSDASGKVGAQPYGVTAMATWVSPRSGHSKLIILEKGGAGRYIQYDLGNASVPISCPACVTRTVDERWNNLQTGSNTGWVYDPFTTDFGWVCKDRTPEQGAYVSNYPNVHAVSDLVPSLCSPVLQRLAPKFHH